MERRFACINDMPIKEANASTFGHLGVVRMITQTCQIWGCKSAGNPA